MPAAHVRRYWEESEQRGEPWAQSAESHDFLPIGLFGDGATVRTKVGSEHIVAFFLNCVLWKPKSVRCSRFLITAIPEERMTSSTLVQIMRRITWSCNHAWYGLWPSQGVSGENLVGKAALKAGQPLTSQCHRFQVTEVRGDWSWHKLTWKFHLTHWVSDRICHLCDVRGLSDDWPSCYWNLDSGTHRDFSLQEFLAERMPPREVCGLAACYSCKLD